MINKEKLVLLATIYMLLPGAMTDALAESSSSAAEAQKAKGKRSPAVQKVQRNQATKKTAARKPKRD